MLGHCARLPSPLAVGLMAVGCFLMTFLAFEAELVIFADFFFEIENRAAVNASLV
jgi:hypothetical protein